MIGMNSIRALGILSITALFPATGMAAGLTAGLYNADGLQQICLQSAGTWYSPTFGAWGGLWVVTGADTHIFGNYNSGAGNDSIVVKGKKGTWTEWSDDLTYYNPIDPITFTKIGTCTDAAKSQPAGKGNPAQR
jgi:hypothetical protein